MNLSNYHSIAAEAKERNARLVVVTKNQTIENILSVYHAGHRLFGENKVQELLKKKSELPADISWHMIGTLQRNKVKQIASWIDMIQSVDTFELAQKINQEAQLNDRILPVLLQFKIAKEETKHGFSGDELLNSIKSNDWNRLGHLKICGVMGMASLIEDEKQIRSEFKTLVSIYEMLHNSFFRQPEFKELSFGMSGDYKIALEEGSTIIRVGSKIFENY
jgi:pyridoxal phosphate enzyme (YggS family)